MITMTTDELEEVLTAHKKWLDDEPDGKRAELFNTEFISLDFTGINLEYAFLDCVIFTNCDLTNAVFAGSQNLNVIFDNCLLDGAQLNFANLPYALFRNSNLNITNFHYANLFGASFRNCVLNDINFKGANLFRVNGFLCGDAKNEVGRIFADNFTQGFYPACPLEGSFTAYKKVGGKIVVLEIPADAQRFSGTSDCCVADKMKVLRIENLDGSPADEKSVMEIRTCRRFTKGRFVSNAVQPAGDNFLSPVYGGITFYISRQMAVDSII